MSVVTQELVRQPREGRGRSHRPRRSGRGEDSPFQQQRRQASKHYCKLIGRYFTVRPRASDFALRTRCGYRWFRPELFVTIDGRLVVVDVVHTDGDSGRVRDMEGVRKQYGHPTVILRVSQLKDFQNRPEKLRDLLLRQARRK